MISWPYLQKKMLQDMSYRAQLNFYGMPQRWSTCHMQEEQLFSTYCKNSDTQKIAVIILKFEQFCFTIQ